MTAALAGSGQEFDLERMAEIIREGLVSLARDTFRLEQIYEQHAVAADSDEDTPEARRAAAMATLRACVGPGPRQGGRGLLVRAGALEGEPQYPLVVVTRESVADDAAGQFLGRTIAETYERLGDRLYRIATRGGMRSSRVTVHVDSTSPHECRVLAMAVSHVIQNDQWRLWDAGVTSLNLSETGFELVQEQPRTLRITIAVTFDEMQRVARREGPVPNKIDFSRAF